MSNSLFTKNTFYNYRFQLECFLIPLKFITCRLIAIKQGFPEGMKQRQTNIIIADNKIAKVVVRFRNLQPNLPVYSQHVYITNPIILIHVLIYRTHTLKTKKKKKNLQVSLSNLFCYNFHPQEAKHFLLFILLTVT